MTTIDKTINELSTRLEDISYRLKSEEKLKELSPSNANESEISRLKVKQEKLKVAIESLKNL